MQGVAVKLDLYFPKNSAARPYPVAVNIHGGSWSMGDKANSDSAADIPQFIDRGYVVAALNYRLAPRDRFPAQIQDVKCAIRYLRANAQTYRLDPNRIGAWGCSAGGHLAALLGLADPSAGFDQGEYLNESSRVQVVATLSAPMDLSLYDATARGEMLQKVFGTSTDAKTLAEASPVNYASKNAAPFLLFQGNADWLVTPRHGEKLVERLTAVGGAAQLITVQNGTHCFPSATASSPNRAEITALIVNFFDQSLRR
jgi:acetyl esterase/lipase